MYLCNIKNLAFGSAPYNSEPVAVKCNGLKFIIPFFHPSTPLPPFSTFTPPPPQPVAYAAIGLMPVA